MGFQLCFESCLAALNEEGSGFTSLQAKKNFSSLKLQFLGVRSGVLRL